MLMITSDDGFTGTKDDWLEANEDDPWVQGQIRRLESGDEVTLGGGAAPQVRLRAWTGCEEEGATDCQQEAVAFVGDHHAGRSLCAKHAKLARAQELENEMQNTRHNPATCRTSTCRNPACSTMRRNPEDEDEGVYTFDELDESAKDRARNWYRGQDGLDYDWWEGTYEDANTLAGLMGIDIDTKRGGRSPAISFNLGNGGGLAFEGSYRYAKGSVAKVKAYAPLDKEIHDIALALQETQREHFYKLRASITGKRRDDGINVTVEKEDVWECPRDAEDGITEALEDFAHWIYKRLQAEEEYLTSDEVVDGNIVANEYTFDEDGHFI